MRPIITSPLPPGASDITVFSAGKVRQAEPIGILPRLRSASLQILGLDLPYGKPRHRFVLLTGRTTRGLGKGALPTVRQLRPDELARVQWTDDRWAQRARDFLARWLDWARGTEAYRRERANAFIGNAERFAEVIRRADQLKRFITAVERATGGAR